MVRGIPASKTILAASGSTQILNSAAGVQFPSSTAPPMMTISAIRWCASGNCLTTSAIFVSGPVATKVIGSPACRSTSSINCNAVRCDCERLGSNANGPASPLSPCITAAVDSFRMSGPSRPAATGMSARPSRSRTLSALRVVCSKVTLPATVVTPRSSISGLAQASMIAMASSWPGSQSKTILRADIRTGRSARTNPKHRAAHPKPHLRSHLPLMHRASGRAG